jgi:hypothetical protein
MQRGLASGDLHDVWLAFVRDDRVEHAFYGREVMGAGTVRATVRVADRAAQVAVIANLEDCEA